MKIRILLFIAILFNISGVSIALDTTEAFDIGFSDAEVYFSYLGFTDTSDLSTFSKEMLIGIGITENFSTSINFSSESNGYLANSGNDVSLGLFWTALSNDSYKVDILTSTNKNGSIAGAVELNLDFDNSGFQLQVEEMLENKDSSSRELLTSIQPLLYYKINSNLELLSAATFDYNENEESEREFEYSSFSLGFNYMVSNSVELISQFDIVTATDEETITGASIGFVAGI